MRRLRGRPRFLGPGLLALSCVSLLLFASAQRRLSEADFNEPGRLVKNAETGKVASVVTELDRVAGIRPPILGPAPARPIRVVPPVPRSLRVVGNPDSRAPPR